MEWSLQPTIKYKSRYTMKHRLKTSWLFHSRQCGCFIVCQCVSIKSWPAYLALDLAFSPPVCFNRAAKALMYIEKVQNITNHDKCIFFMTRLICKHPSVEGLHRRPKWFWAYKSNLAQVLKRLFLRVIVFLDKFWPTFLITECWEGQVLRCLMHAEQQISWHRQGLWTWMQQWLS
jgi:hypothetical protein